MFGHSGFDPRRDIKGIIHNRWGHAYLNPQPGFFLGKESLPREKSCAPHLSGALRSPIPIWPASWIIAAQFLKPSVR